MAVKPTEGGLLSGPKPTPTALKLLRGNPGQRRLPQHEPKPRPVTPECPPYMNATARRRWDELVTELDYSGVLTRVDGDIFAGYCMAYADIVSLTAAIARRGRSYRVGLNGAMAARPEVAMLNRAKDDLRKFGAELGIGAASRTRIEVKKPVAAKSTLQHVREITSR